MGRVLRHDDEHGTPLISRTLTAADLTVT